MYCLLLHNPGKKQLKNVANVSSFLMSSIFLLGDFNVDLLKYDHHVSTNEFLDTLSSHTFLLQYIEPPRVTSKSKTQINNVFSNILSLDSISGNLTVKVSDHLPQFVINIFSNSTSGSKSNIYQRNWTNFDQENFILDYLAEDWNRVIKKVP